MIGARTLIGATALALTLVPGAMVQAQPAAMTFFVTSTGSGNGADLGGLAGADAHCQELAHPLKTLPGPDLETGLE